MARKISLVVIDPQRSFCATVDAASQQQIHDGELCVPGAWEDMVRLSAMIDRLSDSIHMIFPTMDSHYLLHIAHPIWFRDTAGNHPDPFTSMRIESGAIIGSQLTGSGSFQDIGEFTTTDPTKLRWTINYLEKLLAGKRYPHMIWPPHCIIGTPGHTFVEPFAESLMRWEMKHLKAAFRWTKGSNIGCEHFSAIRAEVPDPGDPSTQLDARFVQQVMEADEILLSGEALSHCLANTVRDLANEFRASGDDLIKKCILLEDATSSVPGLEQLGTDFVAEMKVRGMRVTTTVDYMS